VSDEDENVFEIDGAANEIAVETLMGWDGDTCECVCDCPRFRDRSDDLRCRPCIEGRHWPHDPTGRADHGT
jgi:hypothetical protein